MARASLLLLDQTFVPVISCEYTYIRYFPCNEYFSYVTSFSALAPEANALPSTVVSSLSFFPFSFFLSFFLPYDNYSQRAAATANNNIS